MKPIKNLPPEGQSPPLCKCGCGHPASWNQRKNRYNSYIEGHRYPVKPHRDRDWLYNAYWSKRMTIAEIARACGVNDNIIFRFLRKFDIPTRDRSASRIGRKVGEKNPAWKGGVAEWEYAPGWKRIARIIRKRDNYTCQVCGVQHQPTSKTLHVHHIDGDKTHNSEANLITVCATCHPKGKRKEGWKHKNPSNPARYLVTRKGEILGVDADKYITTKEAAQQIGVTTGYIGDMAADGRLPARKIGWYWWIERDAFEEYARAYERHKHIIKVRS